MIALYARTEPQDTLVRVGRKYATLDEHWCNCKHAQR